MNVVKLLWGLLCRLVMVVLSLALLRFWCDLPALATALPRCFSGAGLLGIAFLAIVVPSLLTSGILFVTPLSYWCRRSDVGDAALCLGGVELSTVRVGSYFSRRFFGQPGGVLFPLWWSVLCHQRFVAVFVCQRAWSGSAVSRGVGLFAWFSAKWDGQVALQLQHSCWLQHNWQRKTLGLRYTANQSTLASYAADCLCSTAVCH